MHDLGGRQDLGPVEVERDEPVFHEDWERRVFGIAALISGQRITPIDEFRHAVERMDPEHYLGSTYYEHWLGAVTTLLVEKGVITVDELVWPGGGDVPLSRPAVGPSIDAGWAQQGPPFAVGDRVRVRDFETEGHTRCPRYVRGRCGVVVRVDHEAPLADEVAHRQVARRERTYSVRFDPAELWGEDAEPGAGSVAVDLWHSYLELAP